MTQNIVLLATHSRESVAKQQQYQAAAAQLGLAVRGYPDANTIGVFACSDFRSVDAANLAALHGVPGPDVVAAVVATNKSLAYQYLKRQGFATLWSHAPLCAEDLMLDRDHEIIVKPEKGSGSFAEHPWAYQRYRSLRAFREALAQDGLLEAFLAYQNDPNSWYGRYLTMEYIGDSDVYTAAAVAGPEGVRVHEGGTLRFTRDTMQCEWMLLGQVHPRQERIVAMIQSLYDLGLRQSIIYLQCVDKDGEPCVIDINLRPGTMPDRAFQGYGLPFYRAALAFMLGLTPALDFSWPAPFVGIRRVVLPLMHGRRAVTFDPRAVTLLGELSYDAEKPFDLGHAWPMFAVTSQDAIPCTALAEQVVRDMTFAQA